MKILGFVLLWLAGSAAAVAVAWAGVSIVDDELIDPAPALPEVAIVQTPTTRPTEPVDTEPSANSAATVTATAPAVEPGTAADTPGTESFVPRGSPTASVEAPPPTSATAGTTPVAATPVPPTPVPPTPVAATPVPATPVAATPIPATAVPPTPVPLPPTPVPPTPVPPTPIPPTPVPVPPTSLPTSEPSQSITFSLVGGTTAISFSPSVVQVLWASPNPGFTVEIERESSGVKVEFEADHHESRIEAWWSGGPQHEIREEPED